MILPQTPEQQAGSNIDPEKDRKDFFPEYAPNITPDYDEETEDKGEKPEQGEEPGSELQNVENAPAIDTAETDQALGSTKEVTPEEILKTSKIDGEDWINNSVVHQEVTPENAMDTLNRVMAEAQKSKKE